MHLKQIISSWIKYRSMVITQDRSWWLNMRVNYKSNHICYLIIQILITTLLAQLLWNTRLMLEMGGYLTSVPKREASVAKRWRDGKCQLASYEGSKPEKCTQELEGLSRWLWMEWQSMCVCSGDIVTPLVDCGTTGCHD